MSETDPTINLRIGSQEYQLRRDNSELYHYMGHLAVFNHVFIQDTEDEAVRTGTFVPRETIGHDAFDQLAAAMIQYEYPARLNQRGVADGDADVISKILAGKDVEDINDQFPDWLPQV